MAGVTHKQALNIPQQFNDILIITVATIALRQVMKNILLIEFLLCWSEVVCIVFLDELLL